jgi:hypothetical protein
MAISERIVCKSFGGKLFKNTKQRYGSSTKSILIFPFDNGTVSTLLLSLKTEQLSICYHLLVPFIPILFLENAGYFH